MKMRLIATAAMMAALGGSAMAQEAGQPVGPAGTTGAAGGAPMASAPSTSVPAAGPPAADPATGAASRSPDPSSPPSATDDQVGGGNMAAGGDYPVCKSRSQDHCREARSVGRHHAGHRMAKARASHRSSKG